MPKLTDHDTYEAVLDYAKYKATAKWWKILILGIMAGAFIGVGYLGAITIQGISGNVDPVIQKFLFGAIFPVGILLCVFLGGTLFTSDSLASLPVMARTMKPMSAFKSWGLVLLGNFIGAFAIALIAVLANFFGAGTAIKDTAATGAIMNGEAIMAGNRFVLLDFATHKFEIEWYAAFGSGILCNVVVAGATWMASSTKSATAKFFLLWLPITLFAIVGFQHIIANFFVFWAWILDSAAHKSDYHIEELNQFKKLTGSHAYTLPEGKQVGEWFYNNLIPTTIGNWFGGAILIPLPYYFLNRSKGNHTATDKALAIMTPIVPASFQVEAEVSNETPAPKKSVKAKIVAAEHKVADVIKKDAKKVKDAVVKAEHKVAEKLHIKKASPKK